MKPARMECFFINLDREPERRRCLRQNFEQQRAQGWFLTRIDAVDARDCAARPVGGGVRAAEKACFLSHRLALQAALEAPGHALILEDDVMFGPTSCARIDGAIAGLAPQAWDLIFTDMVIPHPPLMTALLHMRRQLGGAGEQTLLDVNALNFCGATAYVVNQAFKQRLFELLAVESIDMPYDLYLRGMIQQGLARALVVFPFATTLSDLGDRSQVQTGEKIDLFWNAFRRFIWADRDLEQVASVVGAFGEQLMDAESALFARIVGNALSTRLAQEKQ